MQRLSIRIKHFAHKHKKKMQNCHTTLYNAILIMIQKDNFEILRILFLKKKNVMWHTHISNYGKVGKVDFTYLISNYFS